VQEHLARRIVIDREVQTQILSAVGMAKKKPATQV
jgi:hypothetical protein